MNVNLTTLFFIRKSSNGSKGQVSVMARISVRGESCELSTGVKCLPQEWSTKYHKIIGRLPDIEERNAVLNTVSEKLNKIFYQLTLSGVYVSAKSVKATFQGDGANRYYLIKLFEQHNELVRGQVGVNRSQATYQKYQVTLRHLREYLRCSRDVSDILLTKVNYQFICGFELHLRTIGGCAHNTTAKFMQFFKRIILIALNEGFIRDDPFRNYRIKLKPVTRTYLSMEELQRMMEYQFPSKSLELVRDLFVFASFTGIAYIDVKNLKAENLHASFDGELWIRINRQKTEEFANIRLLDIPKRIIEKYADPDRAYIFPCPSNQKVNMHLKMIADLCGIDKPISYHAARHTMATTIGLSNGLPIESLAKMLGHANIRTTQLYARVSDVKLGEDMNKLSERLNKMFEDKEE